MNIDRRALRDCLGQFATGVTIVTTDGRQQPHGATINSFTSVSMEPPLVLVSVDRRTKVCGLLAEQPFVVNILTSSQRALALQFAGRSQPGLTIEWEECSCGPRLLGCLAHVHCEPWHRYDGGDHVLVVGQVREFEFHGGDPLLFFRGGFGEVAGCHGEIVSAGDLLNTPGWYGELPLFEPQCLTPGTNRP